MEKHIFRRLVAAGFIKSLTLSIAGMIDCIIVGRFLGASGLSANMKGMHEGSVSIIKALREKKEISAPFYLFLRLYYQAKYIRRIVISGASRRRQGHE